MHVNLPSLSAYALLSTFFEITVKAAAISFTNHSAQELVEIYFRDPDGHVQFRNIGSSSHSCFALFTNGHSAGRHNTNEFLLPDEGIILSTGNFQDFHINDSDETSTNFGITTGDINLEHELPPRTQVLDPCFIQFEFSCPDETDLSTSLLTFEYVFGSEEYYKQYTQTSFNDVFGFFLNGENIALVPDEKEEMVTVSISNVNDQQHSEYFVNNKLEGRINATSPYTEIEADGFTTKLTAQGDAKPGWNIIKLAIGDNSDGNLDSWVLLEAGTFSCAPAPATTNPTISTLSPSVAPTQNLTQSLLRSSSPTLKKNLQLPSSSRTKPKQQSKARIPKPIAISLMACLGLSALALPIIAYFIIR